ncbi:alcohol oxidase [Stereum hirsutum FP-91666 SS1]|uniref:alcohol oxidase n=1 Tax=Stereum hirsutum (strain FP-91666) TaxID=721885 RepID=UPI000444A3F9|nr:alcohol oxidase [Stereum hirsutum FP-91666 SS1]EIM82202.1 alcohol oxidase [Stereum hirsutum FP-91666 SS1]
MAFVFSRLLHFIVSSCIISVLGALYQNPSQIPANTLYDYIIVGGGAGGGVIVNRLTEEPEVRVLLIEAGSSDYTNLDIEVPGFAATLAGSQFDWNFTTASMPGYNDRSIAYARGFVLGGSTSINFMAFNRGSRDDFDRYATYTGDDGWSWDGLYPYMLKLETLTPPADGRDTTGEIIPADHGTDGPVMISLTGYTEGTDSLVLNASADLSSEFPYNEDVNSGDSIGISWAQWDIADGARDGSARAYIEPALNRSNLDVLVNTSVAKLIRIGTDNDLPIFRGVQFAQNNSGSVYFMNASREVILSAGPIKTPHILMLSGIGDPSVLSVVGIDTIVELPDVGQNLQDHPLLAINWEVTSNDTVLDNLTQNRTFAAEQLALWQTNRTGYLVNSAGSQWGWLRVPANETSVYGGGSTKDPSSGPTAANYYGHYFSMLVNLVSPASRGNITLTSADPFAHPLISANLISPEEPLDIHALVYAVKAARRYVSTRAFDGYIIEEVGSSLNATTDEEIEQWIRNTAQTVNHVSCTVPMGRNGSANGIGDGALEVDLRVKGTVGLRVVDASVFPYIPAAHTMGPTFIIAERAADLLKAADSRYSSEGGAGVAGGVGCGVGFTTTTRGKRLDVDIEFDPEGGVDGACGDCAGCESSMPGRGDTTTQVESGRGGIGDASQEGLGW